MLPSLSDGLAAVRGQTTKQITSPEIACLMFTSKINADFRAGELFVLATLAVHWGGCMIMVGLVVKVATHAYNTVFYYTIFLRKIQ